MPAWISYLLKADAATAILCLSCSLLAYSSQTSLAFERPTPLALWFFVLVSLTSIIIERIYNSSATRLSISNVFFPALDLEGRLVDIAPRWLHSGPFKSSSPSDGRRHLQTFPSLIIAVFVRMAASRLIIAYSECQGRSFDAFIPFAFALYEYRVANPVAWNQLLPGRYTALSSPGDIRRPQLLLLIATFTYAIFGTILRHHGGGPASTYICPASTIHPFLIPLLQFLCVGLDVVAIYCISSMFGNDSRLGRRTLDLHESLGLLRTASNVMILIIIGFGTLGSLVIPRSRAWLLSSPSEIVWAVFKLDIIACITLLFFLLVIAQVGTPVTLLYASFSYIATQLIANTPGLPLQSHRLLPLAFILACVSVWFYAYIEAGNIQIITADASSSRRKRQVLSASFGLLALFGLTVISSQSSVEHSHPVDRLIADARQRHSAWISQAATSKSLKEAVVEYRRRYQRPPPPGFDRWYRYAVDRNSTVIDDFDSMAKNLRPFLRLSPADLRYRTWAVMTEVWTDVGSVVIRDGKVAIGNVPDTHRWMLDGVVQIVAKFSESLPDMDIAFNIDDEPRVSMQKSDFDMSFMPGNMRQQPGNDKPSHTGFTPNVKRAEQFKAAEEVTRGGERKLVDRAFTNVFRDYGTHHCSAWSKAATVSLWDRSRLCTSCTAGHSEGVFMSNWTAANDACTQPDLGHLHGFYLSPSTFKVTHKLVPIFSQSKASGYADILYPSAWNYMDKAIYSPSDEHPDLDFSKKKPDLWWRGGTTEGLSTGSGSWRGMTRQRFQQLLSNTNSTPSQLVLLPSSPSSQEYSYRYLAPSVLSQSISTDVRFTDPILRCWDSDCPSQSRQLAPLVAPTDFQAQWSHKYLLDLDGAGFSGRFLPFLQSKSLVLKAALFREWYDDRIQAWAHFVPLDLRGHGVWATLVYFAGWKGRVAGRMVEEKARDDVAEKIATDAREWVGKALRKEDMEIYMFRLLLEWGRMTDDRRDGLGFYMEETDGGG